MNARSKRPVTFRGGLTQNHSATVVRGGLSINHSATVLIGR